MRPINHDMLLGDSFISGYGLSEEDGFPAQLERTLKKMGYAGEVEHAAMSGATSEWGVKWQQGPTVTGYDAVILELGYNDWGKLLIEDTQTNLELIVSQLAARKIPVLLVGIEQSPRSPADYRAAYNRILPDLAKKYGQLLYPEYLQGVTGRKELFGDVRQHPNRDGTTVIIENMLPSVKELIGRVPKT